MSARINGKFERNTSKRDRRRQRGKKRRIVSRVEVCATQTGLADNANKLKDNRALRQTVDDESFVRGPADNDGQSCVARDRET